MPRGRLLIAACRSGAALASRVVARYQALVEESGGGPALPYLEDVDFQFSDSETCVRLALPVNDCDVFLFQGLYDPVSGRSVDENYLAFLIAARALREHGAHHVTGVLPYLAYARQDKPTRFMREPTTAKLMADLSIRSGMDHLITWHPHQRQISGFYSGTPVEKLEALILFAETYWDFAKRDDVIVVAPDVGASKFVTYFGRALGLESAVASKYRLHPEEAVLSEVIGDFREKRIAIVLDDMISSGGTAHIVIKRLVEMLNIAEVYLGVSHNLCTEQAYERLTELHAHYNLKAVVVTNSIPQTERFRSLDFFSVRDISGVLSRVINRIHYGRSVNELFTGSLNGLDAI
ncbi:MAG: ribose-phosphate pyrophosphokinase [Anaerolineae bacterium]|nr:ribose-phosphate pyrophosphokinase [Anaerolineae bacterium]